MRAKPSESSIEILCFYEINTKALEIIGQFLQL